MIIKTITLYNEQSPIDDDDFNFCEFTLSETDLDKILFIREEVIKNNYGAISLLDYRPVFIKQILIKEEEDKIEFKIMDNIETFITPDTIYFVGLKRNYENKNVKQYFYTERYDLNDLVNLFNEKILFIELKQSSENFFKCNAHLTSTQIELIFRLNSIIKKVNGIHISIPNDNVEFYDYEDEEKNKLVNVSTSEIRITKHGIYFWAYGINYHNMDRDLTYSSELLLIEDLHILYNERFKQKKS